MHLAAVGPLSEKRCKVPEHRGQGADLRTARHLRCAILYCGASHLCRAMPRLHDIDVHLLHMPQSLLGLSESPPSIESMGSW